LFWLRAFGPVSDDVEESHAEALNECRRRMTPEAEKLIEQLVAQKKAVHAAVELGLEDTVPEEYSNHHPRREVHL
jgi:hypothetical protein